MSPPDSVALVCSPSLQDCEDLCDALSEMRVRVVRVLDRGAASELARQNCFVLIILDLDTDSQWRSTVGELRKCAPGAEVVVYSRLPDEHLWIDALEAGAFDFICKPFRERELGWILDNALKARLDLPSVRPIGSEVEQAVADCLCQVA